MEGVYQNVPERIIMENCLMNAREGCVGTQRNVYRLNTFQGMCERGVSERVGTYRRLRESETGKSKDSCAAGGCARQCCSSRRGWRRQHVLLLLRTFPSIFAGVLRKCIEFADRHWGFKEID